MTNEVEKLVELFEEAIKNQKPPTTDEITMRNKIERAKTYKAKKEPTITNYGEYIQELASDWGQSEYCSLYKALGQEDKAEYEVIKYASERDVTSLNKLFEPNKTVDVNIRGKSGITALHVAAMNADAKTINFLLEKGANPNLHTDDGETPLYFAAMYDNLEAVKALLENERINPQLPSHLEFKDGDTGRITFQNITPKEVAIMNGNEKVLELLSGILSAKNETFVQQLNKQKENITTLHLN